MTGAAIRARMVFVSLLLGGVYFVLAVRLAFLHLGMTEPIGKPRPYELVLSAKRGSIYDRHGLANPLATVLPAKQCFVDPSRVPEEERRDVAAALGRLLRRDPRELQDVMAQTNRKFVALCNVTDDRVVGSIQSNVLFRGRVGLHQIYLRHYPLGSELGHVLGYVNAEQVQVGTVGVEALFNRYLTGKDGLIVGEADARRQEIRERRVSVTPAQDGYNVELTIDQTVQHHTEVALDRAMQTHHARAAWAIVMRCRTGEILAMASRPNVDRANLPRDLDRLEEWRNRAIAVNYEPGSTMKALTVAAALNERVITTNTVIDCENGGWYYAKRTLRDKVHGRQPITIIIQKSSNIGTAKIALMLGNRSMDSYLRLAGFAQVTGIDLPGEEQGILDPVQTWPPIKITRVAIGQGISVTALQMVTMYSTIANGGQRMRPLILRRVTTANGEVILEREPSPVKAPIFRPEVAAQMRAMLERVTEKGGTGTRAAVPGYRVAGKTGTAQIAMHGRYSETDFIGSFVGFLPAPDPEIAIVVVVDRPQPYHTGGYVAAPAFAEIALQTVRYLNIPPTEPILETVPLWEPEPEWSEALEDPET
jgi:cell division protein FtsI (penicillin-binding protein 3)